MGARKSHAGARYNYGGALTVPHAGKRPCTPDGKRFATAVVGEPFTTYGVRVHDWPQRKALHTFIGHVGPVTALRFSPDGTYLASGARDTSVLLWDLTKLPGGKCVPPCWR